jgi:hypothetical protein
MIVARFWSSGAWIESPRQHERQDDTRGYHRNNLPFAGDVSVVGLRDLRMNRQSLIQRVLGACRKLRPSWFRQVRKRICARCNQPIKRHERWSAKAWDDGRPRHWQHCVIPPPISVPKIGSIRITEDDKTSGVSA